MMMFLFKKFLFLGLFLLVPALAYLAELLGFGGIFLSPLLLLKRWATPKAAAATAAVHLGKFRRGPNWILSLWRMDG